MNWHTAPSSFELLRDFQPGCCVLMLMLCVDLCMRLCCCKVNQYQDLPWKERNHLHSAQNDGVFRALVVECGTAATATSAACATAALLLLWCQGA